MNEAAARLLAEESQGYPYFIQLLGSAAWESTETSTPSEIGVEAARRGIAAARPRIEDFYGERFDEAWNARIDGALRPLADTFIERGGQVRDADLTVLLEDLAIQPSLPFDRVSLRNTLHDLGIVWQSAPGVLGDGDSELRRVRPAALGSSERSTLHLTAAPPIPPSQGPPSSKSASRPGKRPDCSRRPDDSGTDGPQSNRDQGRVRYGADMGRRTQAAPRRRWRSAGLQSAMPRAAGGVFRHVVHQAGDARLPRPFPPATRSPVDAASASAAATASSSPLHSRRIAAVNAAAVTVGAPGSSPNARATSNAAPNSRAFHNSSKRSASKP